MKILHLLDHSLPLHSGYTFRSREIFRCQRDVGLEPVVVTSPKHEASWDGPWAPEEEIDGVRYYRTGPVSGSRVPFLSERALMARLEARAIEVARRERPRVLHAHSPVLNAIPAIRAGRRLGIPVVYEIRAFWEDAAADHGTYREGGLKYRLVRGLETRACRRAHAVITICRGLRDDLVGRGIPAEKITVVPNAVNPDEFQPTARDPDLARQWGLENAFVVGFLGSFYHYEGLDLLLHALALLTRGDRAPGGISRPAAEPPGFAPQPPSRPAVQPPRDSRFTIHDSRPLKLLLVGGGPQEPNLRALARELGVADRVVFTGRLPHDRMPAMYGLVDVLAFPRKPMRLTETVTPLKPLEAMAMGKPVIASDVGGHRELIRHGETGLLFPAGSVERLAECILHLARSPELENRLRENGRRWVAAERTWRSNGGIYREVYGRLGG